MFIHIAAAMDAIANGSDLSAGDKLLRTDARTESVDLINQTLGVMRVATQQDARRLLLLLGAVTEVEDEVTLRDVGRVTSLVARMFEAVSTYVCTQAHDPYLAPDACLSPPCLLCWHQNAHNRYRKGCCNRESAP